MSSLSEQAYQELRRLIIRLDYAPGAVLREDELRDRLGVGRTPIREAIQRLARDQFVAVVPRKGVFVTGIDVTELSLLYETRAVLEPYAARLAAARGTEDHWRAMRAALDKGGRSADARLAADRRCHETMWSAAGNRFLVDTLDTLYAQSDRVWHMYLGDVSDLDDAVAEHEPILDALRAGDGDRAAALVEQHVRAFDDEVRAVVKASLDRPLVG